MAAANVRTWTGGAYWNLKARSHHLFGGLLGVWTETGQEGGVGLLEANEKKLRKELAEARSRLEFEPNTAWSTETVARCLRWIGDPEAQAFFEHAASQQEDDIRWAEERSRDVPTLMLLRLGTYCRLAGQH